LKYQLQLKKTPVEHVAIAAALFIALTLAGCAGSTETAFGGSNGTAGGSSPPPGSEPITQAADGVIGTTRSVGAATQLGKPIDNLVVTVGSSVAGLGNDITRSSNQPVVGAAGGVVSATGATLQAAGGAVNGPAGSGRSGMLSPVNTAVNSLAGQGGSFVQNVGVIAPLTGLLSGIAR
jgi:hypothetical protein